MSPTKQPRVYVVITSYNGWADTLECLESVLRVRYPDFQVVVCDNASPDGSAGRIRAWAAGELPAPLPDDPRMRALVEPPLPKPVPLAVHGRAAAEAGGAPEDDEAAVVLVEVGENRGFPGGTNAGLRYALARGDADYVWVLNNDVAVDPEALAALVAAAEANPAWGMVGGKLLYYDEPGVVQAAAGGRMALWNAFTVLDGNGDPDDGRWDHPLEPATYVHSACVLVRAEALRTGGLMDEEFFIYSDEVEWCIRIRQAGWRLGYAPGCRVWHKEGRGIVNHSPAQEYHSMRGRLMLLRKHYPHFVPTGFAYSLYRCLLPKVVRRQPERLRAVLRAYRDFFRPSPPPGTNPWTAWERGSR